MGFLETPVALGILGAGILVALTAIGGMLKFCDGLADADDLWLTLALSCWAFGLITCGSLLCRLAFEAQS